jgi:hypothetical protein
MVAYNMVGKLAARMVAFFKWLVPDYPPYKTENARKVCISLNLLDADKLRSFP